MAYSSRLREKPKPLSQMTKAEKEERARQMNAQASATVGKRKIKYANPQRGVSVGNKKSQVGGARNKRSGNTSDSFQCTPTSKSKNCGPNAK